MIEPPVSKSNPNLKLGIALAVLTIAFVACIAVFVIGDVRAFKIH